MQTLRQRYRLTGKGGQRLARLKEKLEKEVKPALMERFGYRNVMEVPTLKKIVINMGVGDAVADPKALDGAVADLMAITGQRPVVTRAKKSVAAFKIRTGMRIGAKVTLRGERMYHFLDKLINVSLPRIRDFRGLSPSSFDGRGNYSLGIREQLVFPEIDYDKIDKIRGMDIVIVTTAKTDEEGYELLRALGMPFRSA
ncbi:MAG: 50S ribosomal protein L5 [Firmicutes bacterium]|nr:50S ribosomal protein L5 [Bacillota bacterium]